MKLNVLVSIVSTLVVGSTWALKERSLRRLDVDFPGYDGPCTYTGTGTGSCCIGVPVCVDGRNRCFTPKDAEKNGIPNGGQCGCCAGSAPAPRPGTGGVTVPFQPLPPPTSPPVMVPFQPPATSPPLVVPFQPVPPPASPPPHSPTSSPTSPPPTGGVTDPTSLPQEPGFFLGPIVITVNGRPVETIPSSPSPPAPTPPRPGVGGARDPNQGTDYPDYDGPCEYFGADDRSCCIGVPVCIDEFIFMCLTPFDAQRRFPDNAECGCCNGGSFTQREYVPDSRDQNGLSSSEMFQMTTRTGLLCATISTAPFLFGYFI